MIEYKKGHVSFLMHALFDVLMQEVYVLRIK